MSKYNIIYLVSKEYQLKKIEESNILNKILCNDYSSIYDKYANTIIDNILINEYKNCSILKNIKDELLRNNRINQNLNHDTTVINLIEVLNIRDIDEIENLIDLDQKLYDMLSDTTNDNILIIAEYSIINNLKKIFKHNKIIKKIYLSFDFRKPIVVLIEEFNKLFL